MPVYRSVNHSFFSNWTPDMAYALGFFAADGNINQNKRGVCYLNIQISDKKLLFAIRDAMCSDHRIGVCKGIVGQQTRYRLQIGSKQLYADLLHLGFTPQKTRRMVLPSVPDELLGHFVRGYFDGDGNVWVGAVHKERKTQHIVIQTAFTSSSKLFLKALRHRLAQKGIYGGLSCRNGYCRLYYSIHSSLELYRLMYEGLSTPLYLERKKGVFERFIWERNAGVV
jgi:intein-encoded DNA endonuclease-like protein